MIGRWTKTSQSLWKKLNSKAKAQDVTILIGGKKLETIICYEQVLICPVLHSLLYNPEIILASSNRCLGRLFNIPILVAINE